MTGDQQPADLLDLPFDQYQRYRIISELLRILGEQGVFGAGPISILDVGGYPGLLPRFVPFEDAKTVVLDVVPDAESSQYYKYTYVYGSGMELPFPDASFSCVVSLDVLEHIPAEYRTAFLNETRRVAKDAAIFIGPVHREETALSEQLLFDYIQWLLKAKQQQLAEHREYGLPDVAAVDKSFTDAGWSSIQFPAGNLYNWLFMMVAKHYLISFRDDQAAEFERKLDHFYNLMFSETDRTEPAYRGIVVATSQPQQAALDAIAQRYPPVPTTQVANLERMELAQILMRLFDLKVANHEDAALREQLTLRDTHIMGLEHKIELITKDLNGTVAHARNMEQRATNLQRIVDDPESGIAALNREVDYLRAEHQKHVEMINDLESDLKGKNEHILYLESLLQKIEAGTVLKLTRNISRIIK